MRIDDNGVPEGSRNEQFFTGSQEHLYQLDYARLPGRTGQEHQILAFQPHSDDILGHLTWDDKSGQVGEVWVHPDHRRQGLASRMYMMAQRLTAGHPQVSPITHAQDVRTPSGEAWAQTLPDYTPIAKKKIKKLREWRFSDDWSG